VHAVKVAYRDDRVLERPDDLLQVGVELHGYRE
jgi:hypothetical protein